MKSIPATERKLAEARHFFDRLLDTANRVGPTERSIERHNLSAFLNAASSVRWVLQKEAKDEYDAWQPAWFAGLSDGDRQLLQTMTKQRNLETKQDGATVSVRASTQIVWRPKPSGPASPLSAQLLAFGSYGELVPVEEETLILKLNGEAHFVLALCEDYLVLLERLVRDFKAAHG